MSHEARIAELGIVVPTLPPPRYAYVPAVRAGNLVFASGQTPTVDGEPLALGKLGAEVSVERGIEAARLCVLNCLAEVRSLTGTLDAVERVVKMTGYVASAPGFGNQPAVINGASELLLELFGVAGQHARAAIGVAELPGNVPGEVELVVAVRD